MSTQTSSLIHSFTNEQIKFILDAKIPTREKIKDDKFWHYLFFIAFVFFVICSMMQGFSKGWESLNMYLTLPVLGISILVIVLNIIKFKRLRSMPDVRYVFQIDHNALKVDFLDATYRYAHYTRMRHEEVEVMTAEHLTRKNSDKYKKMALISFGAKNRFICVLVDIVPNDSFESFSVIINDVDIDTNSYPMRTMLHTDVGRMRITHDVSQSDTFSALEHAVRS